MGSQTLLVVGDGPVAEALGPDGRAPRLGTTSRPRRSTRPTAALSAAQAVVVTSHDSDVDAPAAGSGDRSSGRRTSGRWGRDGPAGATPGVAARARRHRGASSTTVHGPAGLDIGANTPAEIALSILAELVATRPRSDDRAAPSSDRLRPDPPGPAARRPRICPTGLSSATRAARTGSSSPARASSCGARGGLEVAPLGAARRPQSQSTSAASRRRRAAGTPGPRSKNASSPRPSTSSLRMVDGRRGVVPEVVAVDRAR